MSRRAWMVVLVLAVLLGTPTLWVVAGGAGSGGSDAAPGAEGAGGADPEHPWNVVVAVVDDMNDFSCADAAGYLPRSARWLRDQGRCFEDTTTASPVCCPARAILSTGQLPHNNGVRRQDEASQLVGTDTVQHDLTEAGIATYGAGKFLNGLNPGLIASGEFDSGFGEHDFWANPGYYDYPLYDEDGEPYRPDERLHTTVRVGENVRDFIADRAEDDQPFYAYAAFYSPHDRTTKGRGERLLPKPTPQNIGRPVPPFTWQPEPDTRDKLVPFQGLEDGESFFRAKHNTRVRSLYDVDDQMALMFTQLEELDLLDRTMVLFTSDNGFALGQNGWQGKAVPYAASVDVPMLAYLPPGLGERGLDERPVDLVDVAPTVYDVMGVEANHVVDGHSLLGDHVRTAGRLLSFVNERSSFVLQESGFAPFRVPTWTALRRGPELFVQWYRGGRVLAREYYRDPLQHSNLLWQGRRPERRPDPARIRELVAELERLETCAGTEEQGAANPCP